MRNLYKLCGALLLSAALSACGGGGGGGSPAATPVQGLAIPGGVAVVTAN